MTFNAADPLQVKARKRHEEKGVLLKQDARTFVMSHPLGRRFVWHVLSDCGIYKQPFVGNAGTDFNCGRMDVGLKLIDELQRFTPAEFLVMHSEFLAGREKEVKENGGSSSD